jgi:Protein of unknown function (DUF1592)/Protein of unknown function (DUF1588)/Protein of unknown function (DUF1585)/Protein of unknown function (DUF1595)/Protein of unknown function (DUF1587)
MRSHSIPLCLLACLIVGRASSADNVPSTAVGDPFTSTVRPILKARCFGCHARKFPEAGLDLSKFQGRDEVLGGFRTWEKVLHKIEAREMPPEEEGPLTDRQRTTLAGWYRQTFVDLEPRPGVSGPRRLTRTEYRNTLPDLLGIDLRRGGRESFYNVEAGSIVEKLLPADPPGPSGFDNDASVLSMGPAEFVKTLQVADFLVDQLDSLPEARQALFASGAIAAEATPRERAGSILRRFAGRAFRRPVEAAELAPFLEVFEAAYSPHGGPSEKGGTTVPEEARFARAVQEAFKAILISPKFLYRLEEARGSHEPYRVTDHELATRLSYFLWSTMPDEVLSRLASEGRLHQGDVLDRQVERMLLDPRSIALAENFGGQWLGYAELDNPDRFQASRSEEATKLLRSIYREPLLFFDDLVRSDRSVLELIDSRYSFLNPTLGYHYRLKGYQRTRLIKEGGYDWADPLKRVALHDPNRGGVLGMAAIHVLTSAPERTSPIRRGVWVLDAILGQRPPDPPPNIPSLEEAGKGRGPLTLRQQMEQHRADTSCARCHDAIDPLGLALENFGPMGEWRDRDKGGVIDPSTTMPDGARVSGPAELKSLLLTKYREPFLRNVSERMLAYALGRAIRYSDRPTIDRLVAALKANDLRLSVLVKGIVSSVPFGYRED